MNTRSIATKDLTKALRAFAAGIQRQIAPAMDARGCVNHIPSLTMSVK